MPKRRTQDSPVEAVSIIHNALIPFDNDVQQRILASVLSLLGIKQIGSFVTPEEPPKPVPPKPTLPAQTVSARPKSLVELLYEKEPKTNSQKIAIFAYYREKYDGTSRFSRDDLESYFSRARERPPQNYDRDFNKAVKRGWIHDAGAESYLTTKGLEVVETGFGGKQPPRKRKAKKKSKTKAR